MVWTMLGTADVMGRAVCATTAQMACNLGGWSDELGVIGVGVTAAALSGLGDLLGAVVGAFLPDYQDLGDALASFLDQIAGALEGTT
jgi:ABC-type xylose transport system permease subunit